MLQIFMDMNGLNYNKVMPLSNMENPDPKSIYENLVNSDAIQVFKKRHRSYQVGVWFLDGVYYLVQSIKGDPTDNGTIYHNTIYMLLNDAVAIAKCIDKAQKPVKNMVLKQTRDFINDMEELNGKRSNQTEAIQN